MNPQSIAHLAGLSSCLVMMDKEDLPPTQRLTVQFMQNEIMEIVRIEDVKDSFISMLGIASNIYASLSPGIEKATQGKSGDELEAMCRDLINSVNHEERND